MPKNNPEAVLYDTEAVARLVLDAVIKGRTNTLTSMLADLNNGERKEVEQYLDAALSLVQE